MINTKKEADEYYRKNPQDNEPLYFVMFTADEYRAVAESGALSEMCILMLEGNQLKYPEPPIYKAEEEKRGIIQEDIE